jgi:hypothetical protein
MAVLTAQVEEAAVGQRQPDIALDVDAVAVAGQVLPDLRRDRTAARIALQCHVDHAGDGVGAVLRGGAIAQDFQALERDRRNDVEVLTLRSRSGRMAGADLHDRGTMTAMAVHEQQHVVRGRAAQGDGPHERRTVIQRQALRVERRHEAAQRIVQIGIAGLLDRFRLKDIDRHRALRDGAILAAAAEDDHFADIGGGIQPLRRR